VSIVSFQNFFAIDHRVEVRINVTNVCNLHCDFCDHDAHLPFDRHGTRVFRRAPIVADIDAITDFCRAMVGVGERDAHVLQGGEITALPIRTVVEYIDVLHSFGRRVGMRSNGYRLTSIPLDSLNRLDFIYLNAHGNNQSAIEHCQKFLSQHYRGRVILEESFFHRNPADFLHHGLGTPSQGMNCRLDLRQSGFAEYSRALARHLAAAFSRFILRGLLLSNRPSPVASVDENSAPSS
jgi:hypothetical protein